MSAACDPARTGSPRVDGRLERAVGPQGFCRLTPEPAGELAQVVGTTLVVPSQPGR
ncbi:hypothetical protein [Streptomyces phaeofaciens]|uniref:hypothetical protein n=1 Tax=Streptomyces phaeofaciens TaxID=68254 RepID=UPI00367A67FB